MDETAILAPFSNQSSYSTEDIAQALSYASEQYYHGRSVVSDLSYDRMLEKLRQINPEHPFLAQVGSPPPKHRGEVKHRCYMGSQHHINGDDAIDQFSTWCQKWCSNENVHWSLKIDGSSVALIYEDRQLVQAITRGDGFVGMDITANARKWNGIPLTIPYAGMVAVRVEAALPVDVWHSQFFDASEPTNPRNVGNGIICRSEDPDHANQHIVPVALSCRMDDPPFNTMSEMFGLLESFGFEVPDNGVAVNWQHVRSIYNEILGSRERLRYQIDGIVWSVTNIMEVERAGYTDNRPNGQVALKFPTERKTTKVTNISLSMGHTGAIIPTADLEPVFLAGTKVSRALLNNFVYMQSDLGGIGIGDTVEVEKGGDIIPHIVRVVERAGQMYYVPNECPWCASALVQDGRRLKCPNDDCDGKLLRRFKNWVTKVGIKHLGDVYIQALINRGIISSIPDLYHLTLANLQGVTTDSDRALGIKRAQTIMLEINKTRSMTCDVFMSALGITNLGLERAQKSGLRSLEEWVSVSEDRLSSIFGPELGPQIYRSINDKKTLILSLSECIEVNPYIPVEARGNMLQGIAFCFSTCRPTKEEKAFVESQGGEVVSGVSANTKLLVVKDPTKITTKTQQAQKHGTKVISYEWFQAMIKKHGGM